MKKLSFLVASMMLLVAMCFSATSCQDEEPAQPNVQQNTNNNKEPDKLELKDFSDVSIPAVSVLVGETLSVDLAEKITPNDGLSFTATVKEGQDKLDVKVDGSTLSLTGKAIGAATIELTASKDGYNPKTVSLTVTVGELATTPNVGDIIMKDGSLKTTSEITEENKADAIAVVYKVENGKAWAVGNVFKFLNWCSYDKQGNVKIDALVTEITTETAGALTFNPDTYIDGSTGLAKLKEAVTDYDNNEKGFYQAWMYCDEYGIDNNLPEAFQDGWYFPSIAELFDIWKANKDNSIDNALKATSGKYLTEVGSYGEAYDWFYSSSNTESGGAFILKFKDGSAATRTQKTLIVLHCTSVRCDNLVIS